MEILLTKFSKINQLEIITFSVIYYLQKLFREVGELPSLLLCAHLVDAIGMVRLILI